MYKSRTVLLLLTLLISLCSIATVHANDKSDTIKVIATGIGLDSDSALKNALRAAIEQAVGTLVDSETLAENDEIVTDQILSYSAGFVKSHKVIEEPKSKEGLVTIKIQAQVKRTQLTEKLQASKIQIKQIDGQSLFGEVITRIEQKQSGSALLIKALENFPKSVIDAMVTEKPRYDPSTKKIAIPITLSVNDDSYRLFINNLIDVITPMADKIDDYISPLKSPAHGASKGSLGIEGSEVRELISLYTSQKWKAKKEISLLLIGTKINDMRTNSSWVAAEIDSEIMCDAYRNIKLPKLRIDVVDENNEIITSAIKLIPLPFHSSNLTGDNKKDSTLAMEYTRILLMFPVFKTRVGINPFTGEKTHNMTSFDTDIGCLWPGTKNVNFLIDIDASPEEIKSMRNIVCKIF